MLLTGLFLVGTNPNLSFYAWRLHESGCQLSLVNPLLKQNLYVSFDSEYFGDNIRFQPQIFSSFTKLSGKYDVIILSASSLQEFQTLNGKIQPFVNDDSLLIVELTGYINLEPFINLKNPILSIMNEAEIKQSIKSNHFIHSIRNKDYRIYLGATTHHQDTRFIKNNLNFQKFYDILNKWANLKHINFLTSLNIKEFLTYQWKLALPRIVFAPLSIIFECEYPQNLQSQILCKPLITGIIQELFKVIKKMDCKLVKGYENETNLLNNWMKSYPVVKSNQHYLNSPSLFYNFLNNFDIEIDLLLLQPILLADDFNIKSPYLENLYSTLCQFLKINNRESKFFTRLNHKEENKSIDQEHKLKNQELSSILKNISKNKTLNNQLNDDITEQESKVFKLNDEIEAKKSKLSKYNSLIAEKETELRHLDQLISESNDVIETNKKHKSMDESPLDFAQFEQQLEEKELVLKKREQDLIDREQALEEANLDMRKAQPQLYVDTSASRSQQYLAGNNPPPNSLQPQQQYNSQYNSHNNIAQNPNQQYNSQIPNQQYSNQQYANHHNQQYPPQQPYQQPNGYYQSPIDQLPPHGLPHNGLAQNALPPNLRGNNSMTGGGNRYQQLQMQANQMPNPRQQRVGSIPSMTSINEPNYNHPSFNNAAPIDPMVGQRFKAKPKPQNRRSGLPQMGGNLDGIDMGGRGGMPMPNGIKTRASTGNLLNNQLSSPPLSQRKNMSNGNLNNHFQGLSLNQGQQNDYNHSNGYQQQQQQQIGHANSGSGSSNSNSSFNQHLMPTGSYGQHLGPPGNNGISTLSTSSVNTDQSPRTTGEANLQPPISFNEMDSKPLGSGLGNEATTNKKKKKGMFGRSKE